MYKLLISKQIKEQPLLKFSAVIIGYSIWLFLSRNEVVQLALPVQITFSKPAQCIEQLFIATTELPRFQAWHQLIKKFQLFFDIDNLSNGKHQLNTGSGLFISEFPVKVINHNIPDYLECEIN